jgi:hypothetical protein
MEGAWFSGNGSHGVQASLDSPALASAHFALPTPPKPTRRSIVSLKQAVRAAFTLTGESLPLLRLFNAFWRFFGDADVR